MENQIHFRFRTLIIFLSATGLPRGHLGATIERAVIRYSLSLLPTGIYLFKVNDGKNRTMCEICSKLTMKIDVVLVSLLLTLNRFHSLFCCFHR